MAAFAQFFSLLQNHYLWLLGLLLMIEPLLDYHIKTYREWADGYISRALRTRVAWITSVFMAFVACFLAFRDQFDAYQQAQTALNIAKGERDEARRQLSDLSLRRSADTANRQKKLDRLSSLINDAMAIQQAFLQNNDADLIAKQYTHWAAQVDKELSDNFELSYVTQFRSAPSSGGSPIGRSAVGGEVYAEIQGKLTN
jgi:hypothetical protein